MQIVTICAKCGKVHSENDDTTLVVDFKQKQFSFICQNKQCKFDNIFDFGDFSEQSKKSPLPRIRIT
jgi:hypothetical protein